MQGGGGVAAEVAATAGSGRASERERERARGRLWGGRCIEMSIETMRRPLPSDQIGNMLRPTSYEPTKGRGRGPTVHSV